MLELILDDPKRATHVGTVLGSALELGDVLGLTGELGAGKTWLVHGLVDGILARFGHAGVRPRVCSPSYTIINTYDTEAVRIHHMDLYRIDDIDGLESTGYWDVIEDTDAIALVEWMDRLPEAAPDEGWVEVALRLTDPSDPHRSPRHLRATAHGVAGGALLDRLRAACYRDDEASTTREPDGQRRDHGQPEH